MLRVVGFLGVMMMWLARREVRRRSDLPPLCEYVRVAHPLEIVFEVSALGLYLASFVIPIAVTGSVVAGLLVVAGLGAIWFIVLVPVLLIMAVRHLDGFGTRWDGDRWILGVHAQRRDRRST